MTVAVAHSNTARGQAALKSAAREAQWRSEPLAVLHIVAGADQPRSPDPAAEAQVEAILANFDVSWTLHSAPEEFDTADALLELADKVGAALLVIGSRRRTQIGKLILGSTVEQVLLKSLIPVLVVKAS